MAYRELNDESYSKLRKDLIKTKGSDLQRDFVQALKDRDSFLYWLTSTGKITIDENGDDFDVISVPLSEHEFKEQPADKEKELFEKWSVVTPAQACRSTFWGYITWLHIKEGKINSHFLAANGGSLPGGLERIDAAETDSDFDAIVRTALRRFSGLPEARGNRTVYVDCPFARAWWRCHLASQICELTSAKEEKVIKLLRTSQAYWESLVSSVVSRNSVFGNESIRASLIWAISEKKKSKESILLTNKGLESVIKKIGVRLAWQELAILPPVELKEIFDKEYLKG